MKKSRRKLNPYSKNKIPKLVHKLDTALSKLIRERDKNLPCITCPITAGTWHAGHFRRRSHMSTRFNPLNINKQCAYDNTYQDGKAYEYGLALDKKFGQGTAEMLFQESQKTKQWEARELISLIEACKMGYEEYEKTYFDLYTPPIS